MQEEAIWLIMCSQDLIDLPNFTRGDKEGGEGRGISAG